jgi:hypothetical protein
VLTGQVADPAELPVPPDFTFANIATAARFIVGAYPKLSQIAAPYVRALSRGGVAFVGGDPQTGKSTFCATLARELRIRGVEATVVSLSDVAQASSENPKAVVKIFDGLDPSVGSNVDGPVLRLRMRSARKAAASDGWTDVDIDEAFGDGGAA